MVQQRTVKRYAMNSPQQHSTRHGNKTDFILISGEYIDDAAKQCEAICDEFPPQQISVMWGKEIDFILD